MFLEAANSRTFSRRSIHGQIAHEIGLRIVRGFYPPNSILPNEETQSANLNISRTAYREAIKVLAAKGLVLSRPKIGTRIRHKNEWNMLDPDVLSWCFAAGPSMNHARSLFEVRKIVEPAAAAMAAKRASEEQLTRIEKALDTMKSEAPGTDAGVAADLVFHQSILESSGNDLINSLGYVIESALTQSFKLSSHLPDAGKISIPLHEQVFQAIKSRDPARAQEAMDQLLGDAWKDITDVISGLPDSETKSDSTE